MTDLRAAAHWIAPMTVLVAGLVACTLTTDLEGLSESGVVGPDGGSAADAGASSDGAAFDGNVTPSDLYRAALDVDRPSAHWTFDEPSGATGARDRISGRFSPARGMVTFGAMGAVGGAVRLATDGAIEVGDYFDLAGTQAFTIEVWLSPVVTANREFFEFLNRRDTGGYVFYVRKYPTHVTVQFEQSVTGGGGRGADERITPGAFHHVALTYEQKTGVRLYVDGRLGSSAYADPGAADRASSPLRIGANFEGILDELAIYDQALTAERVNVHFAARR